jgi:hypothetical protein
MHEICCFAYEVYARNQTSDLLQQVHIIEFRSAPTMESKNGKAEIAILVQGFRLVCVRRNDGNILFGKFHRECMFFQYSIVAPSCRAIEFCDHRWLIFDANAVNTIFITIQCQKPAVASVTEAFDGRQNVIRLEALVGEGSVFIIGHGEIDYTVRPWSEIK